MNEDYEREEAYKREFKELYQQYLEEEKIIKQKWIEENPEAAPGKMFRGTIAGVEIKALNKRFAAAWGELRRKYNIPKPERKPDNQ